MTTLDAQAAGPESPAAGPESPAAGPESSAAGPESSTGGPVESWMFLGVRFDVLTSPAAPVLVAEMLLPLGASPPAHVHDGLDDSFYVLEGTMVIKCGDIVSLAGPGTWVQFPSGVPHTFRVVGDGPVRALVVHANDSFMGVVRDVGDDVAGADQPSAGPGAAPAAGVDLDGALRAHGVTIVGSPMEEEEALAYLEALGGRP